MLLFLLVPEVCSVSLFSRAVRKEEQLIPNLKYFEDFAFSDKGTRITNIKRKMNCLLDSIISSITK
jgi:hypothetical protein